MADRRVWIATGVIVLLGLIVFLWVGRPPERERSAALQAVEIGDLAMGVNEALGLMPIICPAESLDHLEGSFPEGWPLSAIDLSLEHLEAGTVQRWVYPLQEGDTGCEPLPDRTEVGVDEEGRVVWIVTLLGRTPARLPPWLTPAGVENIPESAP